MPLPIKLFRDGRLPVIQRTQDGDLLNVDGHPFRRLETGRFDDIDSDQFERQLGNRGLVTWDAQFAT